MKNLCAIVLLFFLGTLPCLAESAVLVRSIEIVNAPGVFGLEPLTRQAIQAVMGRATLIHYPKEGSGRSSIGEPRVDELANPFVVDSAGGDQRVATLRVEIERVEYAEPIDIDDDLVRFWAFGLFGATFRRSDLIQGLVQYRAWLTDTATGQELEQVGVGLSPGRVHDLSRTRALEAATCRAAWDLVTELGFRANSEWKLGLRPRGIPLRRDDYRAAVDSLWIETQLLSDQSGSPGIILQGQRVVRVTAGSPADSAGVRIGDRLLTVDGAAFSGDAEHDARLLRGTPGSPLRLRLVRDGEEKELALWRAR